MIIIKNFYFSQYLISNLVTYQNLAEDDDDSIKKIIIKFLS